MTTKAELLHTIRLNCIDCMGGHPSYVKECTSGNSSVSTTMVFSDTGLLNIRTPLFRDDAGRLQPETYNPFPT